MDSAADVLDDIGIGRITRQDARYVDCDRTVEYGTRSGPRYVATDDFHLSELVYIGDIDGSQAVSYKACPGDPGGDVETIVDDLAAGPRREALFVLSGETPHTVWEAATRPVIDDLDPHLAATVWVEPETGVVIDNQERELALDRRSDAVHRQPGGDVVDGSLYQYIRRRDI